MCSIKNKTVFASETDPCIGRASCSSKCTAIGKHRSPLPSSHISRAKECCRDAFFVQKNYYHHFSKCDRDEGKFSKIRA